ncbi:MAG: GAF domain-containing protein [Chloroflexota bacterium]
MKSAYPSSNNALKINALEALAHVSKKSYESDFNSALIAETVLAIGEQLQSLFIYLHFGKQITDLLVPTRLDLKEKDQAPGLRWAYDQRAQRLRVDHQPLAALPTDWEISLYSDRYLTFQVDQLAESQKAYFQGEKTERTALWCPICVGGNIWGVLGVELDSIDPLFFETNQLVETFITISQIISRKIDDEYQVYLASGLVKSVSNYPIEESDSFLDQIYKQVDKYFEPDVFSVLISGPKGQYLQIMTFRVHGVEQEEWVNVSMPTAGYSGLGGWVYRNNLPLFIKDIEEVDLPAEIFPLHGSEEPKTWLGIPMIIHGNVLGVITIQSYQEEAFQLKDYRLFSLFANQIGTAIYTARLYQRERIQYELAQTLKDVTSTLTVDLPIDAFFERFFDLLARVVSYDSVSIILKHDDSSGLALVAHRGFPNKEVFEQQLMVIQEGLIGRFDTKPDYILIPDTNLSDIWIQISLTHVENVRSWIGVELSIRGETIGYLNVDSHTPFKFNEENAQTVLAFANHVTIALDGSRLYQKLEKRAREINTLNQSLQSYNELLENTVEVRTTALETERDRMLRMFELAGEGIIMSDPAGKIIFVNDAMVNISGYTREELLGSSSAIFETDSQLLLPDHRDDLDSAGHVLQVESNMRRKDGSLYPVKMNVSTIYDEANDISGYMGIYADLSAMVETERLKNDFITGISHELRTPLTNLKAYLTLLSEGKPEKKARYLEILHNEINRLETLINDLLEFSTLDEAGKGTQTLERRRLSLSAVFEASVAEWERLAAAENKRFTANFDENLPELLVNREQLLKAIHQIIINGITFTQKGGTVTLNAGAELFQGREMALIDITDNGSGMTSDELNHIFDRFYRSERAKELKPGTGLGLTIAREIIYRHGGEITVESVAGSGTTFRVWLPLDV